MHNPVLKEAITGKANIEVRRKNGLKGPTHHHKIDHLKTPVIGIPK
jgi:hypothetical protein